MQMLTRVRQYTKEMPQIEVIEDTGDFMKVKIGDRTYTIRYADTSGICYFEKLGSSGKPIRKCMAPQRKIIGWLRYDIYGHLSENY